jgi:hypothetical protein
MPRCLHCGASVAALAPVLRRELVPSRGCPSSGELITAGKEFRHSCGHVLTRVRPSPLWEPGKSCTQS